MGGGGGEGGGRAAALNATAGLAEDAYGLGGGRFALARVPVELEGQSPGAPAPTPTLPRKRGREKSGKRIAIEDDGRGWCQVLAPQLDPGLERRRRGVEVSEQCRLGLGLGLNLEVHLGNDPQRAESTDMQLHQVVARDILDHLPAAPPDLTRRAASPHP